MARAHGTDCWRGGSIHNSGSLQRVSASIRQSTCVRLRGDPPGRFRGNSTWHSCAARKSGFLPAEMGNFIIPGVGY